jgi:hypothetical protein
MTEALYVEHDEKSILKTSHGRLQKTKAVDPRRAQRYDRWDTPLTAVPLHAFIR